MFHPRAPGVIYQSREDLNDTKASKDSASPRDNIKNKMKILLAPSAEIDNQNKEFTKKKNFTNISIIISQLEPSAPQEIFLASKIPTNVSLLSGMGASVSIEIPIPRKIII